tara:strand:+ start:423 stop:542 length:120 start_codon:yes stop_codon:yes gene_type:complete
MGMNLGRTTQQQRWMLPSSLELGNIQGWRGEFKVKKTEP